MCYYIFAYSLWWKARKSSQMQISYILLIKNDKSNITVFFSSSSIYEVKNFSWNGQLQKGNKIDSRSYHIIVLFILIPWLWQDTWCLWLKKKYMHRIIVIEFGDVEKTFEIIYSNTLIFSDRKKMVSGRISGLSKFMHWERTQFKTEGFFTTFYFFIYLISFYKVKINDNYFNYYHTWLIILGKSGNTHFLI